MEETEPEILHQLAEQRAQQEQGEELRHELRGVEHEGLRPARKQRLGCKSRGDQASHRREQKDAPPAEGKENEKSERDKDAQKTHGSELRQELVDVQRRRLAKVVAMRDQKIIRGLAAFLLQHAQEVPLGV